MRSTNRVPPDVDDYEDEPVVAPQPHQWLDQQQGIHVLRYGAAGISQFASMERTLLNNVSFESHIRAFEQIRLEAGVSTSNPLEQLLVDGAVMAHTQAARLMAEAAKQSPQVAEIYLKASSRFLGESRKQVLALREYRSPIVAKQVTVVQQQNVAGGHQQIGCVVAQTTPTAVLSEQEAKLLTAQSADTHVPTAMIERAPEPQVDYLRDVFMQTPEVKECLAIMDASWQQMPRDPVSSTSPVSDEPATAVSSPTSERPNFSGVQSPLPRSPKRNLNHGRAKSRRSH